MTHTHKTNSRTTKTLYYEKQKLTVNHPDDAAVARDPLGQLVTGDVERTLVRSTRPRLVRLILTARRLHIVPPREIGVDRTRVSIVWGTRKRVTAIILGSVGKIGVGEECLRFGFRVGK